MAVSKHVTVPGSEKKALPHAKVVGKVDADERIEITVVLRPRVSGESRAPQAVAEAAMAEATKAPDQRQYISREAFAAERGADPDDVAKVEAFAQEHNLTVVEASLAKRSLRLAGRIADLTAAFRPKLKRVKVAKRIVRMRTGGISVPEELAPIVVAVLGFDDRPAARSHVRFLNEAANVRSPRATRPAGRGAKSASGKRAPRNVANGGFSPLEVARLYNFPPALDGAGQCIAIVELNDFDESHTPTGAGFSTKDLKAYFSSLGVPAPKVTAIGVASNGTTGANLPGPSPNADAEVMLDIEVAGAVAPKAKIAVYFALNTDDGFLAAVNAALHDTVRKPSVISISWGSSEDSNTEQARTAFNQVLQDAAALGVTVCCSAGDDGSSDIRQPANRDGQPHVDFPASSPFALACGGTRLEGSGTTIRQEVVWNDGKGATGGGVSNQFDRPPYQASAGVPKSPEGRTGRGVPDVAGDADPRTGYQVRLVGGKADVVGGTSAVAPLWAGLVALLNQRLASRSKPTAGFLNPLLYQPATARTFHDIVEGNNDIEDLGKYDAGKAWDPCTGLGTPDAVSLMTALGV